MSGDFSEKPIGISVPERTEESMPTDPESIDVRHPFDHERFVSVLDRQFPELSSRVEGASRPVVSDSPDELELWEAAMVARRKKRKAQEGDLHYVARLLYEETFSVDQTPGVPNPPTKKGMPGVTTGGLISHFMYMGIMNGSSVESVLEHIDQSNSLSEFLVDLKSKHPEEYYELARGVLDVVAKCTYVGTRNTFGESMPYMPHQQIKSLISNPSGAKYDDDLDSIGFRLLRLLQNESSMMESVEDEELKKRFNISSDRDVSRAELLVHAWYKSSQQMFTEERRFADFKERTEAKEALENLFFLRTHPEMQVFYKFLSPSGHLNQDTSR